MNRVSQNTRVWHPSSARGQLAILLTKIKLSIVFTVYYSQRFVSSKKNRYNAYQGGMLSENEIDLKQAPFYNYEKSPNWYNAVFCPGKTPPYIPFEIFKQTRCASRSKPHSQKDSQQHIYEFLLNKSNYLVKEKPRQINFLLFIPDLLCIMHYPNLNTISTAELYQSKEKRIFEQLRV